MNEKTQNRLSELLCGKAFPLLLLAVMACAFAVQIPQLGFYLDDWVSIAAYDQGGEAGLLAFGIDDSRPFAAWVTAKFFAVLGTGVLQWQLITLFWRFAAALACFWLLTMVWPEHRTTDGFIALLFGVFPFFKHQAICIAYFMILMQYFVVLLSFCFTVKALLCSRKGLKILLFILSFLTSIFHLACLEYYLSLEAARLLLIFFVLKKRDGKSFWQTLRRSILIYLPYALILVGALVYRFVYIPKISEDIRPITLFSRYHGLNVIWHLLSLFLQYLTESILGVWYRSINPLELDLTMRNAQLGLGLGVIAGAVVFFLLMRSSMDDKDESVKRRYEMLFFGFCAMILGYLPGMMTNVSPSSNYTYQDRYLLPSFFGIAIFTVSWMALVFKRLKVRNVLFSLMICISIFFQIQNAFMYRYSWKYQQQFQWSMKWRVPDLAENTAVFSDGAIASFMGGWADSSMLFEMYGKKQGITPTPYWYFNVAESDYLSGLEKKEPIYVSSKMYRFEAPASDVLIMTKPEAGKCAWVLDEADAFNPYLEAGIEDFIPYQNKSRIILDQDHVMPPAIFGTDYVHDWCYYFEKADLAFDRGDYAEALRLYAEAESAGIKVGNPTEMRPFIKAAAFSGDWEQALAWSEKANGMKNARTTDYFANLWQILERDAPDSAGKADALEKAEALFQSK